MVGAAFTGGVEADAEESMRVHLDCVPCLVRQAVDAVRLLTADAAIHGQVLHRVLAALAELDPALSPPEMGQRIHRIIREALANEDPYRPIKERSNALALRLYPELQARVAASPDPLETAVRLAIAGNIIDYGPQSDVPDAIVMETIERALAAPLDRGAVEDLRRSARDARRILYLGDNAGEIVFDRLLIEQLPTEKLVLAVRGRPIINDATREDARAAGLTDRVTVVDNGSDAPGTVLEQCSEAFRARFKAADLILAKGQGNYETLSHLGDRVLFLLMVKCPIIAGRLGTSVGSLQLRRGEKGERPPC